MEKLINETSNFLIPIGESFKFLQQKYLGNSDKVLEIGDEIIIHPVPGVSQAIKSYPGKIVVREIPYCKGEYPDILPCPELELCVIGIHENSNYHGHVINQYSFSRLELTGK